MQTFFAASERWFVTDDCTDGGSRVGLSVAVRLRGLMAVEVAVVAGTREHVPNKVSDYIKHIIDID